MNPSGEPSWSALPVRSLAHPSSAERAAAIARQEAWASAGGARFDALELHVDGAGNSTAHARRPIATGEAIVTVPRALFVSDRDLADTATGEPDPFGGRHRSPRDTLAVWLALECRRPESPWRASLEALPVELPDLPAFRGGEELDALAGTAARLVAAEDLRNTIDTYAAFDDVVRARVSFADYAWGRAIVRSRGFNAPDTAERRIAFIPIVDLMDHAPGETTWRFDIARSQYEVSALRDFAAGEQVHFDYGTHGNAHLLVEYGFALPDNPHDETVLVIAGELMLVSARNAGELVAQDELVAAARQTLARLDAAGARVETPATSAWQASCALVRRGERAVLEQILALAATGR